MIEFHYQHYYIYLLIRGVSYSIRYNIKIYYSQYFLNPIIQLFCMCFGEFFGGFVYLYQLFILPKDKTVQKKVLFQVKKKKQQNFKIYFLFITCFCGFVDLIGSYDYQFIYSNSMKNISSNLSYFEAIFLCFIVCINECYTFNLQMYQHHYLGLSICIFPLILSLIVDSFYENRKHSLYSFLFVCIITIESKFILSLIYIIEKQLNYRYFVNINYLLFMEGFFGMFTLLLYRIIYVFIFKKDNTFLIQIKNEKSNSELLLILLLYSVFSFIFNFCRLRISELTRPSYNTIGNLLGILITMTFKTIKEKKISIIDIVTYLFSFLGFCIYCEIITIKFLNFDKNTIYNTKIRAADDTSKIMKECIIETSISIDKENK